MCADTCVHIQTIYLFALLAGVCHFVAREKQKQILKSKNKGLQDILHLLSFYCKRMCIPESLSRLFIVCVGQYPKQENRSCNVAVGARVSKFLESL